MKYYITSIIKKGDIFRGVINNRLFKVIDLFTEHNKNKITVETLEAKGSEKQFITCELKYFKKLQLIKVEQWVILNLKMLVN